MEIRLLKEHTHKGILHPAGAVIEIPESKFYWFENNGIGEKAREIISVAEAVKRAGAEGEGESTGKRKSRKKKGSKKT